MSNNILKYILCILVQYVCVFIVAYILSVSRSGALPPDLSLIVLAREGEEVSVL